MIGWLASLPLRRVDPIISIVFYLCLFLTLLDAALMVSQIVCQSMCLQMYFIRKQNKKMVYCCETTIDMLHFDIFLLDIVRCTCGSLLSFFPFPFGARKRSSYLFIPLSPGSLYRGKIFLYMFQR